MNKIGLVCCLAGIGMFQQAWAQGALEVEGGYAIPGYIDVAIPGDTGTRFSLTDDLDAQNTAAFRVRYGHTFAQKHWVGLLAAPLTVESQGTLDQDVDFNGTTFPEGTPVDSTFRFDSYRLIYRYLFHHSDRWSFSFGAALKVRDAAIALEGGGLESEKTNTGVVPLLSFNLTWTPVEKWHLLMDGEALAAPQGRAEDVLFAAQYDVNRRLTLQTGYRILEGGSDVDEVYTFALFNSIVAGAIWHF
jgi:hypothetical protein